jgi:hypothetical protein
VPGVRPVAFAPPLATTGRTAPTTERIPDELLGWLLERCEIVFTQDRTPIASPGDGHRLAGSS